MVWIVLLVFILCFYFSRNGYKTEHGEEKSVFEYQMLRINKKTDFVSSGFATIRKELGPDEFLLTNDEDNEVYTLISHFGQDQYECSGTCTCEAAENDERRGLPSLLTAGVVFFVSAFTSIEALGFARNHFEDDCTKRMEEEGCISDSVSSEVDECQIIHANSETSHENKKIGKRKYRGDDLLRYICKGKCQLGIDKLLALSLARSLNNMEEDEFERELECREYSYSLKLWARKVKKLSVKIEELLMNKKGLCEKLELEAPIEFRFAGIGFEGSFLDWETYVEGSYSVYKDLAAHKFHEKMEIFCESNSMETSSSFLDSFTSIHRDYILDMQYWREKSLECTNRAFLDKLYDKAGIRDQTFEKKSSFGREPKSGSYCSSGEGVYDGLSNIRNILENYDDFLLSYDEKSKDDESFDEGEWFKDQFWGNNKRADNILCVKAGGKINNKNTKFW